MAKRFTDTEIWDKEWFMNLPLKLKCLTRFIYDKCDQAGVWSPNWILATSYIGEKVSLDDVRFLKDRFEILPDGKVFVIGFIEFQYGELSENCKPHQKVIALLKKHDLYKRVLKGYIYPIHRVEEKDKEEEEDKEEEKDKDRVEISQLVFSDARWFEGLQMTHPGKDIMQSWNECYNHHSVRPSPPNTAWEWRQKLNTWLTIKKPEKKKPNAYHKGKFVA